MNELDTFIDEIRASESTKLTYWKRLNQFQKVYGHMPESSAEAQEYVRKREDAGLAPATIGLDVAALLRYLKYRGLDTHRLERMPVMLKTPQYLTQDEISALIANCNQLVGKTMIALLYDSGARISEILGVKVEDVDWNGALRVTRKGGRQEFANVSGWGMNYLAQWMDRRTGDHPKVFGSRNYNDMYRILKSAGMKAKLPHFHPHMLRHSRAIHLRQQGVDWAEIGYQLGHVNPTITIKYYTRPDTFDLKQVIPPVTLA
jgi:integrase|tara:strand:- start:152 stop:931 length:780 start_codon:yes stop_codon:yes gene_type:complete